MQKKLKVVDAIAHAIALTNITTQHTRAEEIKNRRFDFAVSRAVAPLKDLWKWSKPLLNNPKVEVRNAKPEVVVAQNPGLICLKGGDLTAEIQESDTHPRVIEITGLFSEEYFKGKYILYVSK